MTGAVPTTAQIVAAVKAADFGTGTGETGTQTLENLLDAIKAAVDSLPTSSLSAADVTGAVPTAAQIVAAIQAADFDEGTGTDTLLQVLATIGAAVAAIPTSNPSAADIVSAVNAATIATNVATIKTAVEHSTHGLSALKTLLDAASTLSAADVTGAVPTAAQIVTAVKAADFGTETGTQTLENLLDAIKAAVDAVPTSNPSAADIATAVDPPTVAEIVAGVQSADFQQGSGTMTLLQLLAALKAAVDALPTSVPSAADVADAVESSDVGTELTAVKGFVENATYGLSALKTLVDTVDTVVDSIKANQEDGTSGLAAIKTAVAAVPTTAAPTTAQIATAISDLEILTGVDLKRSVRSLLAALAGSAALNSATEVTYSDPVLCQNSVQPASTKELRLSKSDSNSSRRTGYTAGTNI